MNQLDSILRIQSPEQFTDQLLDFILGARSGAVGPGQLRNAPPLVRGFLFLRAFHNAVRTSGIYVWFIELYDDYPNLTKLFHKIRALKAAAYVTEALELFPSKRVPLNMDRRFEICDANEEKLNSLDAKFQGASEDAMLKFREYVMAHRAQFQKQVNSFWEQGRSRFAGRQNKR